MSVAVKNNALVINSASYGSASKVNTLSGNALSALGFTGSETSTGTDVAGSFIVNGVTETAKGVGQILTGNSDNTNTADLVVVVSLTASQIASGGTDSTLAVTRGLASALDDSLKTLLDPVDGQMTQLANQMTKSIADAQNEVTSQTAAMTSQQTALLQQFAALESVMANLQTTSNLLTTAFTSSSSSSSGTKAASAVNSNFSTTTSSS